MKYIVTLVAHFEVDAESAAHARQVSRSLGTVGERIGCGRARNNRDFVQYSVRKLSQTITLPAKIAKGLGMKT